MNRKDFRPTNNSSRGISDKDRELIHNITRHTLSTYNLKNGKAEIYYENINGKKVFFTDIIKDKKIISMPESETKEQARGKLRAYNNGTYNEKVSVEGDSSVGIPSYNGIITADYETHYEVKDKDGNYDEIPKRFVHTEKEQLEMEEYYQKEILPTEKSYDTDRTIILGSGKHTFKVKSHSRGDVYGKKEILVRADNKEQIKRELSQNAMIPDYIEKE